MPLSDVIQEVIRLAEARSREEDRIDASGGRDRPARGELERFLRGVPKDQLMKLQTVMYAGRHPDDIKAVHEGLKRYHEDVDGAVRTLMEKVPLGTYLTRGLAVANEQGFDIDAW